MGLYAATKEAEPTTPTSGSFVVYNDTSDGITKVKKDSGIVVSLEDAGGSTDFLSLTDVTDADYTGKSGFVAQVNLGESDMTLVDPATLGGPGPSGFIYTSGDTDTVDTFGGAATITNQVFIEVEVNVAGDFVLRAEFTETSGSAIIVFRKNGAQTCPPTGSTALSGTPTTYSCQFTGCVPGDQLQVFGAGGGISASNIRLLTNAQPDLSGLSMLNIP